MAAAELSDPLTMAAAAASIEIEQLTSCFNAVTMRSNQDAAATPHVAAAAAEEEEEAAGPRGGTAAPERTELEELIARFVDVTVCDGPAQGEAPCAVRVRLPDGRVFDGVFSAMRPVAALFRYCSSAVAACGMAGRPFRLVRFAGGASDEIPPHGDVSLQDLRLDHCILYVVFLP